MSAGKLIIGLAAGVAVGILVAPAKGTDTRRRISRKGKDFLNEAKEKFNEAIDAISEHIEAGKERFEEGEEIVREKAEQAVDKGREIIQKGKETIRDVADDLTGKNESRENVAPAS